MPDKLRGHSIYLDGPKWRYCDTHELTVTNWEGRLCGHCLRFNTPEGHDACLGTLPGVINACRGHGDVDESYIVFESGLRISGFRPSSIEGTSYLSPHRHHGAQAMAFMQGLRVAGRALELMAADSDGDYTRSHAKPQLTGEEACQAHAIGMKNIEAFITGTEAQQAALVVEFNAVEFDDWCQRCSDGDLRGVYFDEVIEQPLISPLAVPLKAYAEEESARITEEEEEMAILAEPTVLTVDPTAGEDTEVVDDPKAGI